MLLLLLSLSSNLILGDIKVAQVVIKHVRLRRPELYIRGVQNRFSTRRFRRFEKFGKFSKISQTLSRTSSPLNLIFEPRNRRNQFNQNRIPGVRFWSNWFRRFGNFSFLTKQAKPYIQMRFSDRVIEDKITRLIVVVIVSDVYFIAHSFSSQ
jgi:hypothetical protein